MLTVVPRDALAIVVLRDLSQSDAKAGKLLAALGTPLPGPLTMIKSIAGIESGLDSTRDLMFVLLPPANNSQQYHLAVWLPTSDYDALVHSLEGDPERRIAAVTIAGEDLLVVHHGDWAVIMDPDERDRLEQLRDAVVHAATAIGRLVGVGRPPGCGRRGATVGHASDLDFRGEPKAV